MSFSNPPTGPIDLTHASFVISDSLNPLLVDLISEQNYSAGILCYKKEEDYLFRVLMTCEIPIEPFNGTKNRVLNNFIKNCYERYSAPHVHGCKDSDFWNEVSSVCDTNDWVKKVVFIPFQGKGFHFSFIFFGEQNSIKKVSQELINSSTLIIMSALCSLNYETIKKNYEVMEYYVKEVGHDISSSVQAIIAKVRNVRRGLVVGRAAEKKLEEAEDEIMAMHRVADTLGIAVDPYYNVRSGSDYDLCKIVESVINLCASEAAERHCKIISKFPEFSAISWCDNKAVESAITQYLINAIKYCHGGSEITVEVIDHEKFVEVSVKNVGMPLDEDIKQRMWGFGERGKRALEHHVNGSGIGLYTVNKIVKAHDGTVYFRTDRHNNGVAVFGFKIPKGNLIEKRKLL